MTRERVLGLAVLLLSASAAADKPTLKVRENQRDQLSVILCRYQEYRAQKVAAIAEEKKYAHEGGGVVDASKLYELQQEMKVTDAGIAVARRLLRETGLEARACGARLVKIATDCLSERLEDRAETKVCADPATKAYVDSALAQMQAIDDDQVVRAVDDR